MKTLSRTLHWWIHPILIILTMAVPPESRTAVSLAVSLVALGTQPLTRAAMLTMSRRDKIGNWVVTGIIIGIISGLTYLQFLAS